uniref:GAF domain-containing protein n=1 Tax=Hucho hucho TaxID=62062 RepID=A0A4W5RML2_9TELE
MHWIQFNLQEQWGDRTHDLTPHSSSTPDVCAILQECVCVYVLEGDSRLQCDGPSHELPKEGKIREVVGQLKRCVCAGLPPSELHEKQRSSLAAPLPPHRRAVIIPLLDQDQGVAISVLLVGCKPLSDQDEQHLNTLEKHAAVACRRVWALQSANQKSLVSLSPIQSHNALLRPEPTDYCDLDRKILQLCGTHLATTPHRDLSHTHTSPLGPITVIQKNC